MRRISALPVILILAACTPAQAVPTQTAVPPTDVPTMTETVAPTSTPVPTATTEPVWTAEGFGFKELPDGFVVIPNSPDEYLLDIHGKQLGGAVLLVGDREIPVSHLAEGEDGLGEGFFSVPRGSKDVRVRLADGSTQNVELPGEEPKSPYILQNEKVVTDEGKIVITEVMTANRYMYKDGPNKPIVEIEPKDKDGFFLSIKLASSEIQTDKLVGIGGGVKVIDPKNPELQWVSIHTDKGWGVTAKDVYLVYWLPTTSWGTDFMLHVPGSNSIFIITPAS